MMIIEVYKMESIKTLLIMLLVFTVILVSFKIVPALIDPNEALWSEAARADEEDYYETMVDILLWIGAEPDKVIEKYGLSPIEEAVLSKNLSLILKLSEDLPLEKKEKVCHYSVNNSHRADVDFTKKLCEELSKKK